MKGEGGIKINVELKMRWRDALKLWLIKPKKCKTFNLSYNNGMNGQIVFRGNEDDE